MAIFDYQSLEAATSKFTRSHVLSESGSGIVYKACLDEKLLVAVKKLEVTGPDAERNFDVMIFPFEIDTSFCALLSQFYFFNS